MKRIIDIIVVFFAMNASVALSAQSLGTTAQSLNAQAQAEYLTPIRPFYDGRNACWNAFSTKFIYAPAFDFQPVAKAVKYRYTITLAQAVGEAVARGDDDSEAMENAKGPSYKALGGKSWTFESDSPNAPLSPVWNDIPVGDVTLKVEALDRRGRVVGIAGERTFLRDFPFEGPYHENVRPYREAAIMAMLYIHSIPQVKAWLTHSVPDLTYKHNTYANKIIGRTVSVEAKLGEYLPQYKEEALQIARSAAQFLINESRPAGDSLAYFPPTYYGGLIASKKYEGQIITMDPLYAANGFMDLYDATCDTLYYNQAMRMMSTYERLQRPDGSFPIKCWHATGEPIGTGCAMLHPLLNFIRRLESQYGVYDYAEMRDKAEKWMEEVAVETFDLTGQFEDVSTDVRPFQNLTNCTACPYASYLLRSEHLSEKQISDARDLISMSEDQFVHWNCLPDKNGVRRLPVPCVFEQHKYQTPVDNSSCNVANAYLDLWEATGDELAFAKAKTLIDALTIVQNPCNGQIPTTLDYRDPQKDKGRTFWLNCCVASIETLLRMDAICR